MKLLVRGVALGFTVLAALGLLIPLLDYDQLKALADSYSSDGSAEAFHPGIFQRMTFLGKIFGIGFLILAGVLVFFQNRLTLGLEKIKKIWIHDFLQTRQVLRQKKIIWRKDPRWFRLLFWLTLGTGIGIRIIHLIQGPAIRYDEAFTAVHYSTKPWIVVLANYNFPNNHIFHSVLTKISIGLFGLNDLALRIPAFLFGLCLLPLLYMVGRSLFDRQTGLIALILMMGSTYWIDLSTNARGYTLVGAAFLSLLLLFQFLQHQKNLFAWSLAILISSLGLWGIPVMVFPLGVAALWLFFGLPKNRWTEWLLGMGSIALTTLMLYSPVLFTLGPEALLSNRFVESLSWNTFGQAVPIHLASLYTHLGIWNPSLDPTTLLQALFAVLLVVGWGQLPRSPRSLLIITLLFSITLCIATRKLPPMRATGYLNLVTVLFFSSALVWLFNQRLTKFLPSFLVILLLTRWIAPRPIPAANFQDAPELSQDLQGRLRKGDRLIAPFPLDAPVEYLALRDDLPLGLFKSPLTRAGTIYVVRHLTRHSSLTQTVRQAGFQLQTPGKPLRRFQKIELYRLKPNSLTQLKN